MPQAAHRCHCQRSCLPAFTSLCSGDYKRCITYHFTLFSDENLKLPTPSQRTRAHTHTHVHKKSLSLHDMTFLPSSFRRENAKRSIPVTTTFALRLTARRNTACGTNEARIGGRTKSKRVGWREKQSLIKFLGWSGNG